MIIVITQNFVCYNFAWNIRVKILVNRINAEVTACTPTQSDQCQRCPSFAIYDMQSSENASTDGADPSDGTDTQ